MKTSVLDLRYQTQDILIALEKGETVTVTERGKELGIIFPTSTKTNQKVNQSPFFGMRKDEKNSVEEIINQIRGSRYDF